MKKYSDIVGDGGSRIVEQIVEQRNKIQAQLAGVRHMLAIGSGKGGVGKSTLVMQIACALCLEGLKVSILDADINGPSQTRLGGIEGALLVPGIKGLALPRTKNGIGILSFGNLFSEDSAVSFQSVAQGESFTWRATREFSTLADIMAGTEWGELDVLLIDLPPGAERTLQFAEFFGARTSFILVTIPSDLSRGIVKRSIEALKHTPNKILGVVENMKGYYCADCEEIKPLFPSSGLVALSAPCLGEIPFDPILAELCDRGEAIIGRDDLPSAREVRKLAKTILDSFEEKGERHEISMC